jgi:uncharacterized membrane protein YraQ (UPF0718 family)
MNPARLAVAQTLIVSILMGIVIAFLVKPGPQETESPVHHHAQTTEQC